MITTSPFGNTGHLSSRVIFGAAALSRSSQEVADSILAELLRAGVNHLDTAANYGESELRLAPFLAQHRSAFFLATKTGERTYDGARDSLERSLTRLGVAQVDLVQLHNLVEEDEWELALGEHGALAALVKAREEGLVRFIGVTGHGLRIPAMHLRSLDRFPFDSVLFPFNYPLMSNPAYRSDVETLLERCATQGVATQTIKSIARRRWTTRPEAAHSWYEPLEDDEAIGRGVRYVLANAQLFLNSSSEYALLPSVLAAAAGSLTRPDDAEMARDVDRYDMQPLFDGRELERI